MWYIVVDIGQYKTEPEIMNCKILSPCSKKDVDIKHFLVKQKQLQFTYISSTLIFYSTHILHLLNLINFIYSLGLMKSSGNQINYVLTCMKFLQTPSNKINYLNVLKFPVNKLEQDSHQHGSHN